MSLFTSFNAGVSGLKGAQSGLNTTGHNFANTKTPGYTRQQNINTDMYYNTLRVTAKSTLQTGYGTSVADIRQIRDIFLDEKYRMEVGRQTFYDVQVTTEQEIEDVLGEMEGVEFSEAWQTLWGTIETLSTNPEEITKRELFLSQAEAFLDTAKDVYDALKSYQINLNTQIQSQVNKINGIADKIAELNEVIAKCEASGQENANDYRDARNLLLDQLAEYTPYDYYESNGQVCVRVNNFPLVDGNYVNHMKCEKMEIREYDPTCDPTSPKYNPQKDPTKPNYNPNLALSDSKGYVLKEGSPMLNVVWERGGREVYDIDRPYTSTDQSDVGSLQGILVARGKRFGYYTDIVQATELKAVKGTPLEQKLLQEYNNTVGNCILERVEAQLDLMIHKVVTTINDIFAPNVDVTDKDGNPYMVGADGTTPVDPTSVTDINGNTIDLTNTKVLDVNRCLVGTDDEETPGTEVFSRKTRERYTIYELDEPIYLTDENGKLVMNDNNLPVALTKETSDGTYLLYVYNDEDKNDRGSLYTAQNLVFNEKLKSDYSYLPVNGNPAEGKTGEYDYKLFERMFASLQVRDVTLDPNALAQYGVEDYYQVMVNAIGTQGNVWIGVLDNQITEVEGIENKRQQISGVATEEEMTFMLMYQHAYNASSRYITVIDQMLEHLIERLG